MKRVYLYLTALTLLCLTASLKAEVMVDAQFEPSVMAVGQVGEYRFTVRGDNHALQGKLSLAADQAKPQLPDGFDELGQGPVQSYNMTNGKLEVSKSHRIVLRANKVGTYTMPSFRVEIGGEVYRVPEAEVQVVAERSERQADSAAKINLLFQPPRDHLYVGESLRSDVTLQIPMDTRVVSTMEAPIPQGDAFTITQPQRSNRKDREIAIDGIPYLELDYPTLITPLKSGEHSFRFKYQMVTVEPDQGRRNPILSPQMGMNQLFNQMMGRAGKPVRHDLSTGDISLIVKPLPEEGKPDSFTGAIGRFDIIQESDDTRGLRVGEPFTLRLSVSGRGNFPRIAAPELEGGSAWKVYEPTSNFQPENALEDEGEKTFEYILMPQQAGSLTTPPLRFAYFIPEEKRYEEISLPEMEVSVAPAPGGSIPPPTPETTAKEESKKTNDQATRASIGLKPTSDTPVQSLEPLYEKPYFWGLNALVAVALAAAFPFLNYRKRLREDPLFRLRSALHKELKQTRRSLTESRTRDVPLFCEQATQAMRLAVGIRQGRAAESMTRQDIMEELNSLSFDSDTLACMARLLDYADGSRYGGMVIQASDTTELHAKLDHVLKTLTSR